MNIVITGATSFIGISLTTAFLKRGDTVYAVIRENSSKRNLLPQHPNLHMIELAFENYADMQRYINGSIDVVFHLTWNGTRNPERLQHQLQQQNYEDSCKFIDACMNMNVGKFIGFGSQAEYGLVEGVIDEDTTCHPNTAYGECKEKTSQYLLKKCRDHNTAGIWVRIFSIYGPGDSENTLISFLIREMSLHHDIPLTLCEQQWDYLYIEDLITYIISLATQDCASGIYNLASGDHSPLKAFVEELKMLMNSHSKLLYGEKPYGKEGIVNLIPNVAKVQNAIQWKPSKSFHEHCQEMLKKVDK